MISFRRRFALWLCPDLDVACAAPARFLDVSDLVTLAELYARHSGLTLSTIATYSADAGGFFDRLKGGTSCTVRKFNTLIAWFDSNWPADLDWPADIPRPNSSSQAA